MQQGGDFNSFYYPHHYPPSSYQNPNPNPNPTEFPISDPIPHTFASAPPYSHYYPPNPPPHNHDPNPPSYPQPQIPLFQPYNPSPPPYPQTNQSPYPYDLPNPTPNPQFPPSSFYPQYETPYDATPPAPNFSNPGGDTYSPYDKKVGAYGQEEGLGGEGVYRYDGGQLEPYGARGPGSGSGRSLSYPVFDDYGRSVSVPSAGKESGGGVMGKIVRAVPKAEAQQDVKNGVQKFRVKLLPEGGSQSTMDVLCQIGLDGIRMLDPTTSRTLRIYPLETVTRWEVTDPSIYSFWSKSSVDIEPRRIRLQSSSYTTSTILDTVTAATVQLKEMGGKDSLGKSKGTAEAAKQTDQTTEKKKGLVDWMNLIKPGNEEKDHWVPDDVVNKCTSCGTDFNAFVRKHHCRNCGDIFCDKCTQGRIALTADEQAQPVRVCDRCMAEVSQRLSNAKEAVNISAAVHSHEDLARKLQEEMEKNRKSSSGGSSKSSDGSGRRMREVACPTCTVHLQVQVPTSGSETIECGVCQHPFLVSAH